jgi:hypothetical protein
VLIRDLVKVEIDAHINHHTGHWAACLLQRALCTTDGEAMRQRLTETRCCRVAHSIKDIGAHHTVPCGCHGDACQACRVEPRGQSSRACKQCLQLCLRHAQLCGCSSHRRQLLWLESTLQGYRPLDKSGHEHAVDGRGRTAACVTPATAATIASVAAASTVGAAERRNGVEDLCNVLRVERGNHFSRCPLKRGYDTVVCSSGRLL